MYVTAIQLVQIANITSYYEHCPQSYTVGTSIFVIRTLIKLIRTCNSYNITYITDPVPWSMNTHTHTGLVSHQRLAIFAERNTTVHFPPHTVKALYHRVCTNYLHVTTAHIHVHMYVRMARTHLSGCLDETRSCGWLFPHMWSRCNTNDPIA